MAENTTLTDTAVDILKAGGAIVVAGGAFYVVLQAVQFLGGLF